MNLQNDIKILLNKHVFFSHRLHGWTRIFFWTRISRIARIFIGTQVNTDFFWTRDSSKTHWPKGSNFTNFTNIYWHTDEHGFFFEHEFHELHEYLLAHRWTRIFFEHETRRRPTDQREVISRITRMWIVWIREIRAIRVQKNKDLCRRYNLCKSVESAGERYLRNMNGV